SSAWGDQHGSIDRADGVTLSRKGAKSRTTRSRSSFDENEGVNSVRRPDRHRRALDDRPNQPSQPSPAPAVNDRPPASPHSAGRACPDSGRRRVRSARLARAVALSQGPGDMTISLAFLAPDLVKAAVEGRLPRGIGVARLCDAPAEWSRQYRMLGLTSPQSA